VLVYATPRGKRLQRQLDQRLEACQDEILAETGATQATQLIRLLTAIETHQAPSAT
jgi:DNA-binding MarR family transcriptional regulator